MQGEVDSEGMMAGSVFFFKFISNGLTNMIIEDPTFLMFPGTSPVRQIRAFFCFCCTFTASIKNFSYAESDLRASQFKSDL
jgi:hypothetical protein